MLNTPTPKSKGEERLGCKILYGLRERVGGGWRVLCKLWSPSASNGSSKYLTCRRAGPPATLPTASPLLLPAGNSRFGCRDATGACKKLLDNLCSTRGPGSHCRRYWYGCLSHWLNYLDRMGLPGCQEQRDESYELGSGGFTPVDNLLSSLLLQASPAPRLGTSVLCDAS